MIKKWYFWGFNKWASEYIIKYEEVDHKLDDETKSTNNIAKALMIDIEFSSLFPLNQNNVNIETFITSFGTLYLAKTIITDLTNCFFEHVITKNNPD